MKYDLHAGRRVALVDYGGVLAIVPALADPVEEAAGILKYEGSLTQALLDERQQEREREQGAPPASPAVGQRRSHHVAAAW